jgi:hypothetical protein
MPRPKQSLARAAGKRRDARLFVLATEDTYAPKQYFGFFDDPRIHIQVLETRHGHAQDPRAVVNRLIAFAETFQLAEDDQLWAVLDTDHWVEPGHKKGLVEAIGEARQRGFRVAMSNPCFELWLLLHHEAVTLGTPFPNCDAVATRIRSLLGEYNKTNLKAEHYPPAKVFRAMQRARALEAVPPGDAVADHWPENTGTRVFLLMEELKTAGLLPTGR